MSGQAESGMFTQFVGKAKAMSKTYLGKSLIWVLTTYLR